LTRVPFPCDPSFHNLIENIEHMFKRPTVFDSDFIGLVSGIVSQCQSLRQCNCRVAGVKDSLFIQTRCDPAEILYLSVITDGKGKFDEWTLSQTANLFLCAFIVTIPAAATNKKIETQKAKEMTSTPPWWAPPAITPHPSRKFFISSRVAYFSSLGRERKPSGVIRLTSFKLISLRGLPRRWRQG
jgi:hypothetical protein